MPMTTIACLSPFSEDLVLKLAGTQDVKVILAPQPPVQAELPDVVADADIVISDNTHRYKLDRTALQAMRRCRLIQQPAVGFDVVDHHAAAELGIPVANAQGYNRDSVADLVLLGALTLVRHAARADRGMRHGGWPKDRIGNELGTRTVGIIGLGNIGTAVAARLKAFGCRILFHDIAARSMAGAESVSQEELLANSDIVTVHVPLDAETRGLIGTTELATMRKGSILINTSRGPVVDEAALVAALGSGHLGGAALDVFEVEPLAADSPLRTMENVFITPHIGGATEEAKARAMNTVEINIRRVIDGKPPFNVVNFTTYRG
ncbi:MAG: hydroxyacid dehydrogenase [Streptosporangiales bacterium]|nr:hydroxyacid dehydrogenase [Streptosporangiales bacterium]